ncbi:uncharacterized protein ARMOST_14122 [Armillaria ostoyae]|uniref:Uncharacterized protein n=1 Tax=Armillaria ostoyae TaxID=47428 RepID=A0A284RPS5_ARMOS|nr:uncharacterized protein ARMOST_14122 [Armillaria ostoyae]
MLKNTKPDFPSTKRPTCVMLNGSKHAYPRLRRVSGFHRRHLSGTHPCVFRTVLQTPDSPQCPRTMIVELAQGSVLRCI